VKNNNKFLSLSIILLLLFSGLSIVSAPPSDPFFVTMTIYDEATGNPVQGASVTVTNMDTSDSFNKQTDSDGYVGDDINITTPTEAGHTIKIEINHNGASKVKNHTVTQGNITNQNVYFDINITYPLEVTLSKDEDQCSHTAIFTATATGGDGDYSYDWDVTGGASYTTDENTLTINDEGVSGTVTVTVSDNSGHDDSASKPYSLNDALSATGSWEATCDGKVEFNINASGGSTPYSYEIKVNGNVVSTNSSYIYNSGWGQSGNWSWTVTDDCDNSLNGGSTWGTPQQLGITCITDNVDHCNGEVTASVNITGGSEPYTIDWDIDNNGSYDITDGNETETFFVGYGKDDSFKVRVTDDCDNQVTCTDTYSTYPQLDVDIINVEVNCEHTQVTFDARATGGSGNYSYAWCADEDGQYNDGTGTRFVFDCGTDKTGTVSVKATDTTTSCTDTDQESYNTNYEPLEASGSWEINCNGQLILTVNAENGTQPYTYEIKINGDAVPASGNSYTYDAGWGSDGTWSWTVTDDCGETVSGGPTHWELPDELAIDIIDVVVDHCAGTAQFFAQAAGGSGSYRYDWDLDGNGSYEVTNGGDSQTIIGHGKSGTVKVRVTDTVHGCTETDTETFEINPELVANIQVDVDHCASTATFTASAQGGSGAGTYTYDWDLDNNGTFEIIDGGAQQVINSAGQDGRVNVRVNDDFCSDTDSANYSINPPLSLDLDVDYGDGVAIFTAEGHGGGEGYEYDWDLDNDGDYEILDGGQEQRVYGYNEQGTVKARVTDNCQDQVDETIDYDIPEEVVLDPPTEVLAKGVFDLDAETPHSGSSSYLVMWYPDNDANRYVLQESTDPDFNTIRNEFITNGTRKKITNMPDGEYYYRVKGCNDAGCTDWSETMEVFIGESELTPNPPTTLDTETLSQTSIALSWTDNAEDETGFKVFRNGTLVGTLPENATAYTDNGLDCGTSYTYYVMAYNGFGNSPASNLVTGTTEDCPPGHTAPDAPTDLSAEAISQSEVEISWTDASDDETGFELYRDGTMIADLSPNTVGYTDVGLECDSSHTYYVVAYNNYGRSADSDTAQVTTDECSQQTTTTPAPSGDFYQATLMSPAYLHALDAEGRHIGRIAIDQVEIEIPGGSYSGLDSHPQIITVYNPQSEIQFYFEAYEEGTVTLNIEVSENGTKETYSFKDLSVKNGSVFLVNSGSKTGQMDLDGDGEYEQQITGIMIQDDDSEEGSNTIIYVVLVMVVIIIAAAVIYIQENKKE